MTDSCEAHRDFDLDGFFELPERQVLSLIDPSLTNGLLSYANAAQTAPTTQGGVTSTPLYGQGLLTAAGAAQTAHSAPNGGTVQNLDSPNSSGLATTSGH
jgi:hypothetical protein